MKIALVLGSGGARGYAHIGVIEELERRGHEIVAVAGASMGALIGGLYAADGLDEYAGRIRDLSPAGVLRLTDFALNQPGLSRATRIVELLADIVGDVRIEEKRINHTALATDIERRREVWFRRGLLVPAIRASISIPSVFTPVRIDGRLLVDGGVLNPLPMEPAFQTRADATVAVSLFGRTRVFEQGSPDQSASADTPDWRGQLAASLDDTIHHLTHHHRSKITADFEVLPHGLTLMAMLSDALDTMQAQIEAGRTAMTRPDVLISVPTDTCSMLDFQHGGRVIEVGRELAREAFDRSGI